MAFQKRHNEVERDDETPIPPVLAPRDIPATPEQLTAIVKYLAERIGGAATEQVDFILGIEAPPPPL
jgi:hypothetical protein